MTTTIKITALSEIGSNLATSTVVPVVNMAGTPTTQKTTVGNIANLALTQAGNAYPAAALATLAQTVTNAAQPNITSVGTLTGLTSTGNVTFTSAGNVNLGPVGNVKITGGSSGQILSTDGAGNLSWVNDSTSYGNSNVAAYLPTYTGDLTAANIVVTGNITPSANVTYNLGNNTNRWNNLYLAGNTIVLGDAVLTANANALIVQTPDGGNFVLEGNANTTFGNIVGVNLDGNSSNILFGNGSFATPPSAAEVDVLNTNGLTTVFYPTFVENRANGQIIRADVDLQYRSDTNTLTVGNIAANNLGNIASVNLNGNNQTWLAGDGTFANINVPTVGNIATINIDGNASNILYGNGAFAASPSVSLSGDGGNLSNINGANVTGIVANANITDYINIGRVSNNFSYHVILSAGDGDKDMHVDDSDNLQYNPNSGLLTAVRVDAQNFVGNLFYSSGYAVANVDGIGNIATINLSGNGSQVLAGNGTWVAQSGGGNASLPLANGSSNINIATANGNVTITANASNTWTFGDDGLITLPGGYTKIGAQYGSDAILSSNVSFGVATQGNATTYMNWSDDVANTSVMAAIYVNDPTGNAGNISVRTGNVGNANVWKFVTDGSVIFPTLTVDIHNGGNQQAQTLQFGDPTQQAIITGPTPAANVNAQRLIIQGQRGNGTGEGGDVYFWAGDSDTNGGDIKIYAGDADGGTGTGGYINIDAGNGPDSGGQLSLSGGYSSNGFGGQIFITPGASGNANGAQLGLNGGDSGTGDGGEVNITGGLGQTNGGPVNITGGQSALGLPTYGNVVINSGASTWTFNNAGNLVLAGGNSVIQSIANSSLDPTLPNVSTMTLTPDANYTSQVLVLDPTAPGHIHLRAFASSNIDEPSANIFLGGENTAFEITSGANNEARIHSNSYTWTFGNDSVLTIPGNLVANGGLASPAPYLSGFSTITAVDRIGTGNANLYSNGHFAANTASFSGNVSGDAALFNDLNLNNLGTNAFLYTNSNRDVYDTQFGYDSANDTMSGGNISLTGTISATNIGNISGVNLDSNVSNVLLGNGSFGPPPALANAVFWTSVPVSNTSPGTPGQIAYDSGGNLYFCYIANNWAKGQFLTTW